MAEGSDAETDGLQFVGQMAEISFPEPTSRPSGRGIEQSSEQEPEHRSEQHVLAVSGSRLDDSLKQMPRSQHTSSRSRFGISCLEPAHRPVMRDAIVCSGF